MTKKSKFKKICVITGSRADYGILSNFLKRLNNEFDLNIIATGSHLSKKFGYTVEQIKKDGFKIYKKVNIIKNKDTDSEISNYVSDGIKKFTNIFKNLEIDLVIVLGDRYEIFSACVAASIMRIKLCHIHGGETTSNALDEIFRHSITIMSQLHFVSAKKYFNRVLQLGKDKKNIFLSGSLSVSNIKQTNLCNLDTVIKKLNLNENKKIIFFQYHPETLEENYGFKGLKNTLEVLSTLNQYQIVATNSNADTKFKKFNKFLYDFKKKNNNFFLFKSINYKDYLSLLKNCEFIIGNSSSAIIEAPTLNIPSINIGNRQHGRLRANSIFDANYTKQQIKEKIKKALRFKKNYTKIINPYDHGNAIEKIIKILKKKSTFLNIKNISFKNIELKR